jgi:hypothetical protein
VFTPIEKLSPEEQCEVLSSLDATAEWETTWDIGLADDGDSYSIRPRWGSQMVNGRWPAGFPVSGHDDPRPWRCLPSVPGGHRHPAERLTPAHSAGPIGSTIG